MRYMIALTLLTAVLCLLAFAGYSAMSRQLEANNNYYLTFCEDNPEHLRCRKS